jgi:hypothetical protein
MKSLVALVIAVAGASCAQAGSAADAGPPLDTPAIDARIIDAKLPIDALVVDGTPGTTVDTCAEARDLTSGAGATGGITINGNLTGYHNDVQPPVACTGFTNDGPDAVYVITVGAGKTITATMNPIGWDGAIEIVQPCVMTPICLAGHDGGNPEIATYTSPSSATLYVVVDSWSDTAFGPYSLNVTVQ